MTKTRQPSPDTLVALLDGPDRPGLVARTSGWIFERGGNILHADQHTDAQAGVFFQRIEWGHPSADLDAEGQAFSEMAQQELQMRVRIARVSQPLKVGIAVSKYDHCFHDILLRFQAGELPGNVVAVISNHETLRGVTEKSYGLPFHHVPVSRTTKYDAEDAQLKILQEAGCELLILARYMQILSDRFLLKAGFPVINIHHSFLPAFAGGKPYHQAFERGVKLIGATAHYATEVLDEGPIIQQDVSRVTHRHGVSDLIRRGRDLEKTVLAQAVRWHLEHRILVYGNKTVVFD
ncbi:MAG: formyltetrahydrofolate deformylase [Opitutales bacterium]